MRINKTWKDIIHTLEVFEANDFNISKTARDLGCARSTLSRLIKELDLKFTRPHKEVAPVRAAEVIECVVRNNYNRSKAAKELGISRERVRQILKKVNANLPLSLSKMTLTKEQFKALWESYGYNGSATAKVLDISKGTVYRYLKKFGLQKPVRHAVRTNIALDTKVLDRLRSYCNTHNITMTYFVETSIVEKLERTGD